MTDVSLLVLKRRRTKRTKERGKKKTAHILCFFLRNFKEKTYPPNRHAQKNP